MNFKFQISNFKISTKLQLLVIVLVTFGVYANSLFNGFVWDDTVFIKEWQLIRTVKGIPYILKGAYPASDAGKYRPMKGIILTLDNKLFGIDPFYYHLQGILIHLATTVMVYAVLRQMFLNRLSTIDYRLTPFLAALIFGVHPVHVEAITFITSSTDVLGITFLLTSFYFYLKQEEFGRRLTGNFWLSLSFAFLAFVSNEITLVLPLLLVLFDLCFKHDFKVPLKFYTPFFMLAGILVFFRYFILKIGSYTGGYFAGSFVTNMLLMPKVIVKYIQLLFWPVDLNVNHEIFGGNLALRYVDFNPEYARRVVIGNWEVLVSAFMVIALMLIAVFFFRKLPILTFLIGWFFISLIPVANVVPINILLAERYIYLASVAFCLGLALVISKILGVQPLKGFEFRNGIETGQKASLRSRFVQGGFVQFAGLISVALIVVFFSIITVLRNLDWGNEKTLWSKTLSQQPQSVIANYNLGSAYLEEGDNVKAVEYLERANSKSHLYFGKMSVNLARGYLKLNEPDKAILELNRAIDQSPENWSGYSYLGEAYVQLERPTKAIENFKISISNNPNYFDARIGLANVYTGQKKYDKALEHLRAAKRINPYLGHSYNNIALIYYRQNKVDEAVAELKRGLKVTGDLELNASLEKIAGKEESSEEPVVTLGD